MWESEIIERKLKRLADGPVQHGHLAAVEGGKLPGGRSIQGNWLARFFGLFRRKASQSLRVVR